jgi:PTS system N-acetylgalactosamine-specific IIA component
VAAMLSVNHPGKYYTVAGLNTAALLELSMESDLSVEELAERAVQTTKEGVQKFTMTM